MTPEEIIEGNKQIAEFDGYKFYNDAQGDFPHGYYCLKDNSLPMFPEDFCYHENWSWLMPVVKKAYDIYLNERGSKYIAEFILTSKYECFWEIKIVSLIEYVWASVVEFIKWHNQHK